MTAAIFLIAALTFTACSYTPVQGVIIDKDTYTNITYIKVGEVPFPQYNTEHRLTVQYEDAEGATQIESWNVTSSVYSACEVGNGIDRTEDGSITCFLR